MPSVTEILSIISRYEGVDHRLLKEQAGIGKEAHAQVLSKLKGLYIPPSHNKTVLQLVDRTMKWADLMIAEVLFVELELKRSDLVGHLDLVCRLKGYGRQVFIIDLKFVAQVDFICWLQLAGYKSLYMKIKKTRNPRRRILWVPKGRDKIKLLESPCSYQTDLMAFIQAKQLHERSLMK
jgi:hypothetical protein